MRDVLGVLFDFSFCSPRSIPIDFDVIDLEMGPSRCIDFKVPKKILVYDQCSQLRTSAESNGNLALLEGHNCSFQKRDISSPRDPQMPECRRDYGYPPLFITTHLPLILMALNGAITQFLISCHQTAPLITLLYRIICRHSDPTPCFQNFAPWLIITLSNIITLEFSNTRASQFLDLFPTSEPLAHMDIPQTTLHIKLFLWWKFPFFKELTPSFLKHHWFSVCLSQKAKTNQFTRNIAGKFNQPYK